jgi:hypothetical protein
VTACGSGYVVWLVTTVIRRDDRSRDSLTATTRRGDEKHFLLPLRWPTGLPTKIMTPADYSRIRQNSTLPPTVATGDRLRRLFLSAGVSARSCWSVQTLQIPDRQRP